ncbi:MAG: GNAT family N-acetyltransferase [Mobilitalea sp.]
MNLFHTLEGKNVRFQQLNAAHAKEVHAYASDTEVSRFIGWRLMNTLEETSNFIQVMLKREAEETHLYASVVLKDINKVIGTVMIFDFDKEANKAEIGYVFHKDYWGKGYGAESLELLSDYAFEKLQLHKLHAAVVDVNIGSARILEKNGYVLEGRLKDHYFIEGKYYDGLLYGKIS